ncbi:MAG: pseudouridine synthase [Alphaproteobacteria bacterium]
MNNPGVPQRIAKIMARLGICSRRQAEALILEGKVSVNGKVITSPALNVSDQDQITYQGKTYGGAQGAQKEKTRLWLYHKPKGLMCTYKDPENRPTVFQDIQTRYPKLPYLISVGRLDFNSEGLLLLTNDGELARQMCLPTNKLVREYRVRVRGHPTVDDFRRLAQGVSVDGVNYGPIVAELESFQSSNSWVLLKLTEGKNREIRKVMEYLGYTVSRLIRISFGEYRLGEIKPHEVKEVE